MRSASSSLVLLFLLGCGEEKADDPVAGEGTAAGDCTDGADNDADGSFDCDDDGCAGAPDCAASDENAAPSGAAIAIEPAVPGDDDDLNCVIVTEATDPNGDAVTYRYAWSKNGTDAGLAASNVSAALTTGGDTWTCTVTPTDGTLEGAPTSATVSIAQGNRAPSAPTVSITPAAPTDDDVLTCVIGTESVDPDGDAVTYAYAWSVDGTDAGITGASVNAALTEAGQQWTCAVTASDGELTSGAASVSVEVSLGCDADGDGYDALRCGGNDCDDTDGSIHPRAGDTYGDGLDEDCDGMDCVADSVRGAYFVVCPEPHLTWMEAQDACLAGGYDGLASITSSTEQDAINTMDDMLAGGIRWIGLHDRTTEGSFQWADGTSYGYTYWQPREPSGAASYGDEDCVVIQKSAAGGWNDSTCDNPDFVNVYIDGYMCSAR